MKKRTQHFLTVLSVICLMVSISGCSIFISTPRTAKIRIQGLDNKYHDAIIALDEPVTETNLDIRISKRYTLQLDLDWLWDSEQESRVNYEATDEEIIPPLAPWMLCKYRF